MRDTARSLIVVGLAVLGWPAFADEPGALASPDEKLEHLLASWRGKSLEDLQKVWGKETESERRGDNRVYLYERRIKARVSVFGGVTIHGGQGLQCAARFYVNPEQIVTRVTRIGGGKECWNAFRRYEVD